VSTPVQPGVRAARRRARLALDMQQQPDEDTCGPTCLHALYRFYGDEVPLPTLAREIQRVDNGGTLAVFLANHALRRGYQATIYTYNLQVFDPTWFRKGVDLAQKLRAQALAKGGGKLLQATQGYLDFLALGGVIRHRVLDGRLLRGYVKRGVPVLAGLSATYLYGTPREFGPDDDYDDVRGHPSGHFVVLSGYDREKREVRVSDPMQVVPVSRGQHYWVSMGRLLNAILLGIVTYDANLLIITRRGARTPEG
jgi:hypothetical protein